MSWNTLYVLLLLVMAVSLLSMLKKQCVSFFVKLLRLDKVDVIILLACVPAFLFFLDQNMSVNFYDERRYLGGETSQIFRLEPERLRLLTTYGYCMLVTAFKELIGVLGAKITISVIQFILFLATCVYVRNLAQKNDETNKLSRWCPLFLIMTNLYLLQATTLLLTDISAACFVAIGISAFVYLPQTTSVVAGAVGALAFAGMIRPAALCFLIPVPIIYFVRHLHENDCFSFKNFLRPVPAAIVVFLVVIFPQLMINQNDSPDRVCFPIVRDLNKMQKEWGRQVIRYETCVNKDIHGPRVRYRNPDWLSRMPGGDKLGHIAAMFDQGEVDAFKRSFDSPQRKVASFFYYLYLYLAGTGILAMSLHGRKMELALLGLSVLPYLWMLSSCAVEPRFAYPCIILSLPLAMHGTRLVFKYSGNQSLARRALLLAIGLAAWEFLAFRFSYWLDTLRM